MNITQGFIIIGLALAFAGALLFWTASRKLIRAWLIKWKIRLFGKKPPAWPDLRYKDYQYYD